MVLANDGGARARVAWVVGGTSGIGRAAAARLGADGFSIVVSGRRRDALDDTVAELRALGHEALGVAVDVTSDEGVAAAAAEIRERVGSVDLLVLSAGTNVARRWWSDLDPKDFASVVDTNLVSVARVVHAVLPGMRATGSGQILVVSSWAGWTYMSIAGAAYGASKTALATLVETLNDQEGRHGVRATHLCPAEVETPILLTRAVPPTPEELERMLRPEQVADVIGFLADLPASVCVNELVLSATDNRIYRAESAYRG